MCYAKHDVNLFINLGWIGCKPFSYVIILLLIMSKVKYWFKVTVDVEF